MAHAAFEEAMKLCDEQLDACVKKFTPLSSAAAYYAQLGGIEHVDMMDPQLPFGKVDYVNFKNVMTQETLSLNAQTVQLVAVDAKIKELTEKLTVSGLSTSPEIENLINHRKFLDSRMVQYMRQDANIKWRYMFTNGGVSVMNGKGFKTEMSALLQHKFHLTLSHQMEEVEKLEKAFE